MTGERRGPGDPRRRVISNGAACSARKMRRLCGGTGKTLRVSKSTRARPWPLSILLVLLLALLTGCQSHAHRVGLGPTGIGAESARQFYFLFGLVRLNEVDVQRMASELTSYSIATEFSLLDLLLAPLLAPLTITSRTVTVEK